MRSEAKHFLRNHCGRVSNAYSVELISLNRSQWVDASETKSKKHLIYHINKRLGIVPTKTRTYLAVIADREDVCDHRGALLRTKRMVEQGFQSWNAVAEQEIGQDRVCAMLGQILRATRDFKRTLAWECFLVPIQVSDSVLLGGKFDEHLIHRLNKGLSVVTIEALERVSFIAVGEDVCDQGDALIQRETVAD